MKKPSENTKRSNKKQRGRKVQNTFKRGTKTKLHKKVNQVKNQVK